MISIQLLLLLMIVAALIAIEAKVQITSIIALGSLGLALALSFLFLKAPDLAAVLLVVEVLTLTVLVRLTVKTDTLKVTASDTVTFILAAGFLALFFFTGILALRELPRFGSPLPPQAGCADASLMAGSKNIVTYIALLLRSYDTLAGIAVLFAAAAGVRMLLKKASAGSDNR